ncbi:glutathione S-transferase family protein [Maribrevibacterium harenarium]|uniref:Glutathione S-transferase family protein n=1 Tax=Maribrevibacterium harenarium TaxID=2589817 RepID=A0A501X307_9GAMM|nr:glutathione S-transferase family protein [Maribrevibacterium harenarium]TPE54797.1 glutathione S-transferase family protein [Maribrevibacterium harenarium]
MGLLVDGKWVDQWYDTKSNQGRFKRTEAQFRNWLVPPAQVVARERQFPAESGRYHLYVSLACPWAHRTLIMRQLKGLEEHISVSCVHPHMLENGWQFQREARFDNSHVPTGDPLYGLDYAYQLYTKAAPNYSGRVTVPILWDKQTQTIVSNESAEIIRMFNHAFNELTGNEDDYYPSELRQGIDKINEKIYHTVNNGVYKAGFATTQDAYEEAVTALFQSLDELEQHLSHHSYLVGNRLTEADWRLFTTLIRFDPVYVGHFKCNLKRIIDYPALNRYLEGLYHFRNVADTCDFTHIKQHYYYSHDTINPTRVVPHGPDQLFR